MRRDPTMKQILFTADGIKDTRMPTSEDRPLARYAITYQRMPLAYHDKQAAVVEAETPALALELLQHELGDHTSVKNHVYSEPVVYVPPASRGRVVCLKGRPPEGDAA